MKVAAGDRAVGALGASSHSLVDDRAVGADAELGLAVANNGTLARAGRAATGGRCLRGAGCGSCGLLGGCGSCGSFGSSRGRVASARVAAGATLRSATAERLGGAAAELGDRLAGVGEGVVGALSCLASAANVCSGHVGEAVKALARTAGNVDGSAVHVHLAVADLVEPGPSHCQLTLRKRLRNGEVVGTERATLCVEVALRVRGRAATNDRVDDLPLGVLGGLQVLSDGDLARSATVGSSLVGRERDSDVRTDGPLVHSCNLVADTLAGEVGARGLERALDSASKGDRVRHEDVSGGGGSHGQHGSDERSLGHSGRHVC